MAKKEEGFLPHDPEREVAATRYYNRDIHLASFALPGYIVEALEKGIKGEQG